MKNINEIICQATNTINNSKARSAWARGVREYALDLVENLKNRNWSGRIPNTVKTRLLPSLEAMPKT